MKLNFEKNSIFTSKSNVLKLLKKQIKLSQIEKILDFTVEDWQKNKNKILAIGDSLRTDILGANNFQIDSALVLSGINGKIKEIEKICKKTNIYPKFLFNTLKW